ncbi:hypothetical protein BT96DRAFT_1018479 [Gymnopus androsaceus JB14]|uniref:Uncharacterized protein n=1 Tax=Gymnopus androsaceus JB14 TaxID=1447944 RepID=A0A6A4HPR5_9AGAR|nr:hypothetical protein BT96DRAFT_1018479 [Gymnopus androsaceus JB14]
MAGWSSNTIVFVLGMVSAVGGYKSNSKLITACGLLATFWSFVSFLLTQVEVHAKERDQQGHDIPNVIQSPEPSRVVVDLEQGSTALDPFFQDADAAITILEPSSTFAGDSTGVRTGGTRRIFYTSNVGSPEPDDLPDWIESESWVDLGRGGFGKGRTRKN